MTLALVKTAAREPSLWEQAAADPAYNDAESLYLALAFNTDLVTLRIREQAARLAWTVRKVYRVRASLAAKGWAL